MSKIIFIVQIIAVLTLVGSIPMSIADDSLENPSLCGDNYGNPSKANVTPAREMTTSNYIHACGKGNDSPRMAKTNPKEDSESGSAGDGSTTK
ncbi:hypothetical protein OAQ84_01120 [Bdellovibrionales bacterium]|nr:hypothetical protein [Bdellovibrionales bacterium]